MTGTNTFTGASGDLQYIINQVWSPKIEVEFKSNLLAADFFTDMSSLLSGGGNIINIADAYTNNFSASTKTVTAEVTLQSPAQAALTLTVATWDEVSFLIEDREAQLVLQSADVARTYADKAKYTIAKAVDTAILANYSTISGTVSDTASDITDGTLRSAIATIVAKDVPFDQLRFFFQPQVIWEDLMGISKLSGIYRPDAPAVSGMLGGNYGGTAAKKAYRGTVYGIPVMETTNLPSLGTTTYWNLLAAPNAFMYAFRTPGGNLVRSLSSYQHPNLGTLWTVDTIFGTAELRDEAAIVIKSRKGGIVS
jgi:hypothetical protein